MTTKIGSLNQHQLLHQYWPDNCCLCNLENKIRELEERIKNLEILNNRKYEEELERMEYII